MQDIYAVSQWILINPPLAVSSASAYDYLNEGMEIEYAKVIGAISWKREHKLMMIPKRLKECFTKSTRRWSRDCGWFSWFCGWIEDIVNVIVCTFKTVFVETLVGYDVPIIEPHDGIVTAASARGDGSLWKGEPYKLQGVNHNEMNDHDAVKRAFDKTFRGKVGENEQAKDFFKSTKD